MIQDLYETKAGAVGPTGSALGGLQDYIIHQQQIDGSFNNFDEMYEYIKNKKPTRASSLQGACMVMKASAWKLVGPLENGMPLGADDFDYSIRIKEKGYPLYVSEKSYVLHRGHASGSISPENWNNTGSKSWDYFNKKWDGYYFNELEAINCIWGHKYHLGWDIGTGWMDEQDRLKIWEQRKCNYDGSEIK
jgi:GT2 family glycosyltransferase